MHDLIYCILRMEDYTEIMPVVLNYFAIESADINRMKQKAVELTEAILALKEFETTHEDKSGVISYYIHELTTSKKKVEECINTAQ